MQLTAQINTDEILRQLRGLSEDLQYKAVRSGLVQAIKPVKSEMKSLVPVKRGHVRDSIGHRQMSKTAKARLNIPADVVALLVGPTRKVGGQRQSRRAHWLEEGTKPHKIQPKQRGRLLAFAGRFSRRVQHPGTRATHFMTSALDRGQSELQSRFYQGLSSYLKKAGS